MPIDPNGGNGDPDGGNPEPWRMPNDDPNDPDGDDDYVIIDPEG